MNHTFGKFGSIYQVQSGTTAPVTLPIYPTPNVGESDQQLFVSGTVGQFSNFCDPNTSYLFITTEGSDFRVRWNSDPDTATGHLIENGSYGMWPFHTANEARFIAVTGTAIIHATPMRFGYW